MRQTLLDEGQHPPLSSQFLEPNVAISTFTDIAKFLRSYWARLIAISVAASIPCLWHPRIEASDLPSHVYNA